MTGNEMKISRAFSDVLKQLTAGAMQLTLSIGIILVMAVPANAEISYWSPQRQEAPKSKKKGLLGTEKPKQNPDDPDPAYSELAVRTLHSLFGLDAD